MSAQFRHNPVHCKFASVADNCQKSDQDLSSYLKIDFSLLAVNMFITVLFI